MTATRKNPHAVALGKLGAVKGGQSKSPAKQAAARLNGKKGGRPVVRCLLCGLTRAEHLHVMILHRFESDGKA